MKKIIILLALFSIVHFSFAQSLEESIDSYILSIYPDDGPGASVLISKKGKILFRKSYGLANIELQVPMKPENVFELGSITKQFTSVAILMLEEQGKLSVKDKITKYIPDYPSDNKTITIHHLLNHTSGIKSYTSMPSFLKMARQDMTPTEIIDVFKNEPMDFDPGEQFLYNNSGYILLGYIIEKVSGISYEEYVETNFFEKIGMGSSYYGKMKQMIPNRAAGYQPKGDGYQNADYLSLTLPYAAGSLMSTVDDMLKWQNAINNNTFITRSSLNKAINGSQLNSGENIEYGYGWINGNINGSSHVSHGGGIFGYTTSGIYFPKEDVYVIGLTNCTCKNIGDITMKIGAMAIGKPFPDKKDEVSLSQMQLKKWVGAYQFDGSVIRHITMKNGKLFSQREGSTNLPIFALSDSHFIFDEGTTAYNFSKDDNEKRMVIMKSSDGEKKGKEVNKAPPAQKKEITVSSNILKKYVGKYELQPGFILTIRYGDGSLYAQATGQPEFPLFAESETNFFLKAVPASIFFKMNKDGSAESLTLHQGGAVMPAKKIE
ncbi:MAG: serine hydrolase [Saprospiraceae bacterium]